MQANTRRFTSGAPLLAIVLLSWSTLVAAENDPSYQVGLAVQSRLDDIAQRLYTLRSSVLALATLEELDDFAHWATYGMSQDLLLRVAEDTDTNTLVREQAFYQLALALFTAGEGDEAEALLHGRGYLTSWSVIGPFANDGMAGLATAYGPELERSHLAYSGKVGDLEWRDATRFPRLGYVNLGDLCRPNHAAVSYAVTTLRAPRRMAARLWSGVDGAYRIWLNGELIAEGADLGGGPIREWVDVRLRRGDNEVVVKLGNETGPMGFFLHITDLDGTPIVLPSSAELLPVDRPLDQTLAEYPRGSVLTEIEGFFEDEDALPGPETPSDHSAAAYALHRNRPRDPTEPWRAHLSADGACADDVTSVLYCAAVFEHGWQQRELIESALRESADDARQPWLMLALASLVGRGMGADSHMDSVRILDRILADHPDFVPAQLMLARIYANQGASWAGRMMAQRAFEQAPDSPEAVYQAQLSREETGSSPELLGMYRRTLTLETNKHASYMTLAPALVQAGDAAEAQALLREGLQDYPTSLAMRWLLSDLLINAGEEERAEAVLLEATDVVPGEALVWERLGRFYLQTNQPNRAEEPLRIALALEPQNRDLTLFLARLGGVELFYQEYTVETETLGALDPPEDMVVDNDFLILVDQTVIRIHHNGLAHRYVQQAFRPLTRQGADELRRFSIRYTPDAQIVQIITAHIIKTDGTVLESYSRSDESLSQPWFGLYYDTRALHLSFDDLEPGDTLEVAYTLSDVGGRNILDDYFGEFWFVQDTVPKVFARFALVHPEDMELAVRPPDLPHSVLEESGEAGSALVFELENVPAVETERSMPGFSSVADYVHVSTFETWTEVGRWYWNLIEDQLATSPEIEQTVSSLVQGLDTTREKVAAIHEYVVRNTRYVGLEFGIQGYRPHRTTVSFERRFGDCKDTASLMKVMLGLAGIDSYLVLVRTRDNGSVEPTPASLSVFNHVITYVPELDLFLDGTAGHAGLSELPSSDQGASALIVLDGEDARFITTPRSRAENNELLNEIVVDLENEGSPASMVITATGQFAPGLRRRYEAGEHRLEQFQRDLRDTYSGARVTDLSFEGLDDITIPVEVHVLFGDAEWLRPSGETWRLQPLGFDSDLAARMAGTAEREQAIDIPFPYRRVYHQTYRLPPEWRLHGGDQDWSEENRFGAYVLSVRQIDSDLLIEAFFELRMTEIFPHEYTDFRDFLQNVDRTVNRTLVLEARSDG